MADSDVQLAPDGSGKLVDTGTVSTGAGTVHRQRVAIGDPSTGSSVAAVLSAAPVSPQMGLAVYPHNYNWVKTYDLHAGNAGQSGGATLSSNAIDLGDLSSGGAGFGKWRVLVSADQAGTLSLQQSADNSTWYTTVSVAFAASAPVVQESLVVLRYLRAQVVNGSVASTVLFLHAALVAH